MARVLVVDDSSSARALVGARLRENGYVVEEAEDAETAVERAIARPPDVVVTDLIMAGLSGVQLCRLLRNETSTAHVPVVLMTASGDKRSRYWARSAGAAAYVGKDRLEDLIGTLPDLLATRLLVEVPASARVPSRRAIQERVSAILDTALFESVVAGEVRSLARSGDAAVLFDGLLALLGDVVTYRWLALAPSREGAPLFVHSHTSEHDEAAAVARAALGVDPQRTATVVSDDRPVAGEGAPPETANVTFAGEVVGRIAIAGAGRGMSREDKRMVALVASELGGPLQMTALYEDARRLAVTDTLTSLPNRRAFLDAMERERARSDRHVFPMSLLLVDVDHFKRINDTRGHAAGDAVLQGVARVLEKVARRSDFVARWGGEEFVVGLPQTGETGARVAGERVRRAIAEALHPAPEGEAIRVTVSVGVASASSPWAMDALVAAADEAMYAAKGRGRNRVEVAMAPEAGSWTRRLQAAGGGGSTSSP